MQLLFNPAVAIRRVGQLFSKVAPVLVMAVVATACALPADREDRLNLRPVAFKDLRGWEEDRLSEVIPALLKSCSRFVNISEDTPIGGASISATVADLRQPCKMAKKIDPGDEKAARTYFETWFTPFYVTNNGDGQGLFTGYFEVGLEGRWTPDEEFHVPLYKLPDDHVTVELGEFDGGLTGLNLVGRVQNGTLRPYPTREIIDAGAIAGRGLELVWIKNIVDAFMLHVQGSGRISLPGGKGVRLGYAGNNGYDYSSIGRELVDRGEITMDEASWYGIRRWIENNPSKATSLLAVNRRYIFFREVVGNGPIGAQGVTLTAGRSLAVDTRFLPLGLPLWLDTTQPGDETKALRRLMMAQDTGNAIRSPVRGDFFWGFGKLALESAGRMRSRGSYYLLLPSAAASQL